MGQADWPRTAAAAAGFEEEPLSPPSVAILQPSGKQRHWLLPVATLALIFGLCLGLLRSPSPMATHIRVGRLPGVTPRLSARRPSLGVDLGRPGGLGAVPGQQPLHAGAEAPDPSAEYFAESLKQMYANLDLESSNFAPYQAADESAESDDDEPHFASVPMLSNIEFSEFSEFSPTAGGPPRIALWFPNLTTLAQWRRGERGVSLKFYVSTIKYLNVISPDKQKELALPIVNLRNGGTPILHLGAAHLGNWFPLERSVLVTKLEALAEEPILWFLPEFQNALGRHFLDLFAAVEFRYRDREMRFHLEYSAEQTEGLVRIPTQPVGKTGLLRITLNIGALQGIPALVDTSSPMTLLSPTAATATGLWVGPTVVQRNPWVLAPPLRVTVAAGGGQELDVGEVAVKVTRMRGLESLGLGDSFAVLGHDVLQRCGTLVLCQGQEAIFLGRLPAA
eukprot:EG_transcript_9919